MAEFSFDFLVPSPWEMKVTVAAALVMIAIYSFLTLFSSDDEEIDNDCSICGLDDNDKMDTFKGDSQSPSPYVITLELLAAKNLVGANLNGTSDPYAIITCGSQKRFSSMVPGSRNPLWGEEFNFFVDELPVQVCFHIKTIKLLENSSGILNGIAGGNARRRISSDKQGPTVVHQKPGPLQTIFNLPPDEVVNCSYSCALERSFLYHGRMYVSAWHICFHSNVFSKQMKVILPFQDIHETKRSQHAVINPSITIILRMGCGGCGVPPLGSPDGRVRYKFASFWNRNHAFRMLQRAAKNFKAMVEAEKKEMAESALRSQRSSVKGSGAQSKIPDNNIPKSVKFQAFVKEEVLVGIVNDVFPCTAEQFFNVLLSDDSKFLNEYRSMRKDTNLNLGQWNFSDEYNGQVREITFRALCQNPMCPPDTAMTEWQHAVLSSDKEKMVFETVQQAHDVPFGSYFEVHCSWSLESVSESTCNLDIKVGAHIKKWCVMQSKIKSGAINEYKKEVESMLDAARAYLNSVASVKETNEAPATASSLTS